MKSWKKVFSVMLVISILASMLVGCEFADFGEKVECDHLIEMEMRQAFINQNTDILLDGESIGEMEENGGIFSTRWSFWLNNGEEFYMEFGDTDSYVEEMGDSGATYVFYNMQDEVIGYARNIIYDFPEAGRNYVYQFFDADFNRQPICYDEEDKAFYDYDHNFYGDTDHDMRVLSIGNGYKIEIRYMDQIDVDMMYILFAYTQEEERVENIN